MNDKNKDLMIYVLTHKVPDYGLIDDEYHTPIHCGAVLSNSFVCDTRDDTKDNISEKNPWFLETTGIYWIWKNDRHRYVGNHHYRRILDVDINKIPNILCGWDIIVPKPVVFGTTVYKHYCMCHIKSDIDLCINVVRDLYPFYSTSFEMFLNNMNYLYYSNGFITKRENYNRMCSFVFNVLFEFERRTGFKTREDWVKHGEEKGLGQNSHKGELTDAEYQSRVCGYLSERLVTFFILINFEKRYEVPYRLMENNMAI